MVAFAEAMPLERELQTVAGNSGIRLPNLNKKTIINLNFSMALVLEKAWITLSLPCQTQ